MDPQDIINAMANSDCDLPTKVGTISNDYVSGDPRVVFDGESTENDKTYPCVSGFTPKAGDGVMLIEVKGNWIIIGKVE